jgi:creatinine amidohydrolase
LIYVGAVIRRLLLLGLIAAVAQAAPLPRDAAPSIELEALTWPELREAIRGGVDTVLVPIGGTEQNGLHMAATTRAAAERLGRTLVAPVIPVAPEGEFDPPTGNLTLPGTLGISEAAMAQLLDGVVQSLRRGGFRIIVLIGDHGGSQAAQAQVARRWDRKAGVRVLDGAAYYGDNGQEAFLARQGFDAKTLGAHAGVMDTAELMAAAPERVRRERIQPPSVRFDEPTGSDGDATRATPELGRQLLELKVARIVALVEAARAGK